MKKLITLLVIMMLVLIPFSATANSTKANQPVIFNSYQNNGESNIVLEKFIYNEKNEAPYTFSASVLMKGQNVDATNKLSCTVSDNNVIKADGNGVYAVGVGKAQVTVSCNGSTKTYNVEVIDPMPISYRLTEESITISNKWVTKLVQVYADMKDGNSIEVGHATKWESMDPEIATMSEKGVICGESKGKTIVTATINDTAMKIPVEVLDSNLCEEAQTFLDQMDMRESLGDSEKGIASTKSERDIIIDRAAYMRDTWWTPTQNLIGWKEGYTFSAGSTYRGIPYTKIEWTDRDGTIIDGLSGYGYDDGFMNAMEESNFYTPSYVGGLRCPRYGADCSSFVSASFRVNRHDTGGLKAGIGSEFDMVGSYSTSSPSASDLMDAYENHMQGGDAVVSTKKAHTYIIGVAYSTHCICYEQTTYYTKVLVHQYDDMAADKYMPFAK